MQIKNMTKEQFATFLQEDVMNGSSVSNIIRCLDEWMNKDDFDGCVRPLMNYLGKHCHPHMKAVVESNSAELVESVQSVVTDEYLVD